MLRRRELRVAVVALILLTAGCGTTAELTDEPRRNATLSGYDPAANTSPVAERAFWDRSSTWEDPRVRNVTVTSRTYTYRNRSGADAVVVYTTPKKPYVQADRPRSMSPVELAALATRSVDSPPLVTDSRPAASASLLDRNVTVQALSDAGDTTGYVAHATTSDAVVIVVVSGDADDRTIERVLDSVTLYGGFGADG